MIKEFTNADYGAVRTTLIDEQPYFCLVDVARIFGIKNVQNCRTKIPSSDIATVEVDNKKSSEKKMFVTAKYLSTCLFTSKKAEAEMIFDWLNRVCLPQLLKYYDYQIEDFSDPETVLKFLDEYQDLRIKNTVLETTMKINKPKIMSIDRLLGSSNCIDLDIIHEVLKFQGIRNMELLRILRATHILDENNQPYQEFCDRKYFRVIEAKVVAGGSIVTSNRTYVYKSGIAFIERILKNYEVKRNVKNQDR